MSPVVSSCKEGNTSLDSREVRDLLSGHLLKGFVPSNDVVSRMYSVKVHVQYIANLGCVRDRCAFVIDLDALIINANLFL
jgi:hypothetical protein